VIRRTAARGRVATIEPFATFVLAAGIRWFPLTPSGSIT